MIYKARPQIGWLLFLLVLTVIRLILASSITTFDIIFISSILIAISFHYKLKVDPEKLRFQVLFLNLPVYKRQVTPEQISEITFKRIGWGKKGAIVQVKQEWNLRVILFTPDQVFKDLEQFAYENNISINKTKDYKIFRKVERGS